MLHQTENNAEAIFKTFHSESDENSQMQDVLTVADPAIKWVRCH